MDWKIRVCGKETKFSWNICKKTPLEASPSWVSDFWYFFIFVDKNMCDGQINQSKLK